jgi:hypothetical protein
MVIQQTGTLQQHPTISQLVAQRNPLLEQVIGPSTAEGVWDLTADAYGRQLLRLWLRDQESGQGTGDFAPEELKNEAHLTTRLHNLQGALQRVGRWRKRLQQLYTDIRQWCQQLPGGATIIEEPLLLREERSGQYEATRLVVTSNGQTLRVEPVASWVVGAAGRVDVKGIGGPFILLLSDENGGWFYLPDRSPINTIPLTEALFLKLAQECLYG